MTARRRVAALGLDAADPRHVDAMIAEGVMPALARLRARGATVTLTRPEPYRSELPWTEFATGHSATSTGYWGTLTFDPVTYEVMVSGALPADPWWALGDEARVVAFDVPHSVISERVSGVQVTAWGEHGPESRRSSLPVGLLSRLDARFGPHPATMNDCDPGWYSSEYLDALTRALVDGAERRVDALEWLVEQVPDWDLLLTATTEAHSGGHHLAHGFDLAHPLHDGRWGDLAREHLRSVYGALDRSVDRFVRTAGDDAVVVVFALHGMQGNGNDLTSLVLLPELLRRAHGGRPALRCPGLGASVIPAPQEQWIDYVSTRIDLTARDAWRNRVKRVLPAPLRQAARRSVGRPARPLGTLCTPIPPESGFEPGCPQFDPVAPDYQVGYRYRGDWPRMRWFALPSFSDGHVRLNVRGREGHGVVDPSEFVAACQEVVDLVSACRDPGTGRPLLARAVRLRDDAFDPSGPPADVVLLWEGMADAAEHPTLGRIGPVPWCRTGEHGPNGWLVASGPGIDARDHGVRPALDVPPTLLALAGLPTDPLEGTALVLCAR